MRGIDELRPLTAGRLLTLWREHRDAEPLERALLCNAAVLAESCFCQGEPAFESGEDVLAELTGRQMEELLRTLAGGAQPRPAGENPAFDSERFLRLKGE
ncbi:hypothetical protein [Oscillibacter sp.]|uniref:hypothetical protein n=1 Tax=Oscillibacter sp. TaxID=1945593 RepID=UPI001B63FE9D|nr:hypothetical protein [Oscillibacter sp.]MBP3509609.1 hypothetical protein [Oscillibacter sp.]